MNHWLTEELTWLSYVERQGKLNIHSFQTNAHTVQAKLTFATRVALKLSDWLISTGESIRQRYEKNTAISPWVDTGNLVH
jgi:hypothetical protein